MGSAAMSARETPLIVSWFPTAFPDGPAIGDPERTTWGNFADVFAWRREGDKDGPNYVLARLTLEPDGRHVRRLKRNVLARTAVALDCETNNRTGEIPPRFAEAVARIKNQAWAAVIYTSHSHRAEAPRYRIVLPLSEEIAPELPAVEVIADSLGLLGVLDHSKIGAASLFYLPSAAPDELDHHEAEVIDGNPIDAAWMRELAGAMLAERQGEDERIAALAHAEAEARREAKIAAGFDPEDSLIEKLRAYFDLTQVLLSHGYHKSDTKFRHANSTSGSYGADIKVLGGIERVFSHNANDPLHATNLPDWCGDVTAVDAVDAVIILDFASDRSRALRELSERFGITKTTERRQLAGLIFCMGRDQASPKEIEASAYAEGLRLGLTRDEVHQVARWVAHQATTREAA